MNSLLVFFSSISVLILVLYLWRKILIWPPDYIALWPSYLTTSSVGTSKCHILFFLKFKRKVEVLGHPDAPRHLKRVDLVLLTSFGGVLNFIFTSLAGGITSPGGSWSPTRGTGELCQWKGDSCFVSALVILHFFLSNQTKMFMCEEKILTHLQQCC